MKVITTISGIDAAPSAVTITGAIPVTRITPASPTTNAPHQFVSLASPPPSYSRTSEWALAPVSLSMAFLPPRAVGSNPQLVTLITRLRRQHMRIVHTRHADDVEFLH